MFEYVLLIFTTIIIVVLIGIRLYYPFWSHQPVCHTYDFIRPWILPAEGALLEHAPQKRKFCDFFHVKTRKFWEIADSEKRDLARFLQANYITAENVLHVISAETLDHQLAGFVHSPTISIYFDYDYVTTATENPLNIPADVPTDPLAAALQELQKIRRIPQIRACMLTTQITLYDTPQTPRPLYYWDAICTKRTADETHKYTQRLIQTNDYNIRLYDNRGALFKKEIVLCDGIVPFIEYRSYSYIIAPRFQLRPLSLFLTIRQLRKPEIDRILAALRTSRKKYVLSEIGNLVSLLDHHQLFVFSLNYRDELYGIYFVKHVPMHYENIEGGDVGSETAGNAIQLVASVKQVYSDELFVLGWEHVLHAILKVRNTYRVLLVDEMGDNGVILNSLNRALAFYTNAAAYYLYNYGMCGMPFDPRGWLVLV